MNVFVVYAKLLFDCTIYTLYLIISIIIQNTIYVCEGQNYVGYYPTLLTICDYTHSFSGLKSMLTYTQYTQT